MRGSFHKTKPQAEGQTEAEKPSGPGHRTREAVRASEQKLDAEAVWTRADVWREIKPLREEIDMLRAELCSAQSLQQREAQELHDEQRQCAKAEKSFQHELRCYWEEVADATAAVAATVNQAAEEAMEAQLSSDSAVRTARMEAAKEVSIAYKARAEALKETNSLRRARADALQESSLLRAANMQARQEVQQSMQVLQTESQEEERMIVHLRRSLLDAKSQGEASLHAARAESTEWKNRMEAAANAFQKDKANTSKLEGEIEQLRQIYRDTEREHETHACAAQAEAKKLEAIIADAARQREVTSRAAEVAETESTSLRAEVKQHEKEAAAVAAQHATATSAAEALISQLKAEVVEFEQLVVDSRRESQIATRTAEAEAVKLAAEVHEVQKAAVDVSQQGKAAAVAAEIETSKLRAEVVQLEQALADARWRAGAASSVSIAESSRPQIKVEYLQTTATEAAKATDNSKVSCQCAADGEELGALRARVAELEEEMTWPSRVSAKWAHKTHGKSVYEVCSHTESPISEARKAGEDEPRVQRMLPPLPPRRPPTPLGEPQLLSPTSVLGLTAFSRMRRSASLLEPPTSSTHYLPCSAHSEAGISRRSASAGCSSREFDIT